MAAPRVEPDPAKDPPKGASLKSSCGRGSETFGEHRWVPPDAKMVASVRLDATDLDLALDHLEQLARSDGSGLPITVGFTLSQLRLEVSILQDQLAAAGFRPAELVRLGAPDGTLAWVFPLACDLARAKLLAGAAWKLDLRITVEGTLGEPRPGVTPPFPYAALFLPGDRVALVPAGALGPARAWLHGRRAGLHGRRAGKDPAAPLGKRLDNLDPAAIRVVLGGHAFLTGDAATAPRELRITGAGVEIDGSLRSSP